MTARTRAAVAAIAVAAAIGLTGCGDDGDAAPTTRPTTISGTFVGQVNRGEQYLALLVDGERVAGYLCDDGETSVWIASSEIDDGRAELRTRSGEAIGQVELVGGDLTGAVHGAGHEEPFELVLASGEAGLYRAVAGTPGEAGAVETGWIVLGDGSVRGAKNSFVETGADFVIGPAPSLGNGGAGGAGVVDLGQGLRATVTEVSPSFIATGTDF